MRPLITVSFSQAKDQLSALTTQANDLGLPFVITKNNKSWVEVWPLATDLQSEEPVTVTPVKKIIRAANLDELFEDFDNNSFIPREDGFTSPIGDEEI